MMKKLFILPALSVLVLAMGCSQQPAGPVTDIIPPLKLNAGTARTVQVSDLFYASSYDLKFVGHDVLKCEYSRGQHELKLQVPEEAEGLYVLKARLGDERLDIPVTVKKLTRHDFRFKPAAGAEKVSLFGSFNSWNRHDRPMSDEDGDGVYELTLPLEAGRYEYRFYVDGQEFVDPVNPDKVPNPFGEFNSLLVVPPRHEKRLHVHNIQQIVMPDSVHLFFAVSENLSLINIKPSQFRVWMNNRLLPVEQIVLHDAGIKVSVPREDGAVIRCAAEVDGNVSHFQQVTLGPAATPQRWDNGIVYSIMIDRFSDGDASNNKPIVHPDLAEQANYRGGDLQGIIDKIDEGYFDDLGINILWLFPVVDNPETAHQEYPEPHRWFTGYHGYWPVHHQNIEGRFGDMALFKTLVDKAHAKGYRVLLDFVANHVHQDHIFYKEHPEWFGQLDLPDGSKNIRHWDEYRLTTWFDTFLPSFDYLGSPEAMKVMTDNAVWWLKETGIDGFRQDAVKHIPNEFWRELNRKISTEIEVPTNTRVYQIGETFGGYDLVSSYVNNGQLDAQFNFQLYDVGQYVFLSPEASFADLDKEMQRTFDVYGQHHLMGNLMDSHDKVRFMAQADGDVPLGDPLAIEKAWTNRPQVDHPESYQLAQLYLAMVLTIPGVPVIYYGDEIGLTGAHDPDNRRPMRFGDDLTSYEKAMKGAVTKLIQLRRDNSALRQGDMITLKAEGDVYAYLRTDMTQRVLVVLNKGRGTEKVQVTIPDFYRMHQVNTLLGPEPAGVQGQTLSLKLPGLSTAVYELK